MTKTVTQEEYEAYLRTHRPEFVVNGRYINAATKISHTHLTCGHEWLARPTNIKSGRGCPMCRICKFDPTKPVTVYILIFDGFLKYGITNILKNRLKDHRAKNGKHTVHYTKTFTNGKDAIEWEKRIKNHFGYPQGAVSKEMCPCGYTETLPLFLLEELEQLC